MTPDDYFAALAPAQRSALESLRATIRTVTSDLVERRSSGAPFFWYRGRRALGLGAARGHLSVYLMHGRVLEQLRDELAGFEVSSTVIRFASDRPLPAALIRRLVKARLAEIDEALRR
jgi:uncharacterized protein YdhG (YjbR/CyaY superfamily)